MDQHEAPHIYVKPIVETDKKMYCTQDEVLRSCQNIPVSSVEQFSTRTEQLYVLSHDRS